MKKILRKTSAMILAMIMLASAAACNNSGGSKESKASGEPSESASNTTGAVSQISSANSTELAAGEAKWEPFSEKVQLKVPVYDRGVEGVPNVAENYWTKWIQSEFGDPNNIEVTFVPITRSDVMTDYALLASSEDLPTILMEYDYPKVAQWANDGYLTTFDMNDFKEVAPTYYSRMEENNQLPYSVMNGQTYFALALRPFYDSAYTFQEFVRLDWLEEVGYDHVPVDYEDYKEAMLKIKEAGLAEYPGGGHMVTGRGSDMSYQFRTFPYDEADWAQYGDVNIPALGHYANKEYLRRENELYNLGIINPEYYITDQETEKAQFVNGQIYKFAGYISSEIDFLTAFYEHNPDAKLAIKPMNKNPKADNETPAWRADNPFGMIIGFSSFASEEEIEAAWRYMEWMTQEDVLFTMQWGLEGENFNYGEDNLPVSVSDYSGEYKQGFNNSKDYWCITIESRNAGTIDDIMRNNLPQDLPQNFNEEVKQFYNDRVELSEKGYAINDALFSVVIEAEVDYSGSLLETYKEYRDRLTMCSIEEFSTLYDKLAKEYAEAGFQEIVDERLEAYEANKSTKLRDAQKAQ
jgi:putative aldouronate transport system substrate-binding protein